MVDSKSSFSVFWAYARLARRITLICVTEILCNVAGAAVAPFCTTYEISNDMCGSGFFMSSEKTGFTLAAPLPCPAYLM